MNADFEAELDHWAFEPRRAYRRRASFDALNRRLSEKFLWLARAGDAMLADEPWAETLVEEARARGVELVSPSRAGNQTHRLFTPWGWTPGALRAGEGVGASVEPLPFEVVARVNSKLWSHALEVELGVAIEGAATASTLGELNEAARRACPRAGDKWVVKSPYGFAARERVLGRGPAVDGAQAAWASKRLARGETLIFQPWLEVLREYGVVAEIARDGSHTILGVSDLQTNGAGTGTGYVLGRPPSPGRMKELEGVASVVCGRLYAEGYCGPVGIDAIEHARGLHPLLEVNARYTMGFIAVAVERAMKPAEPVVWNTK
ncbi:MAG TPA: hypothetical protein VGP08_13710 [Pyrinomonadaceae bacterium]|jgi:hypothetical protein|nr:hypothetical protein [Pyrinomonadaceae bacterium]